jgi:uncharacterized LabA/DUF88 family protein
MSVINIMEQGFTLAAKTQTPPVEASATDAGKFQSGDVVAYIDMQNLHHFLKENCRVPATQVHLPNLIHEFAAVNNFKLKELRFYTGIHDATREPHKHEAMAKRIRWLERNKCKVVALPLSYYSDKGSGEIRAQEKGVDVRMSSEILRDVNDGLQRALVISQDKDISQAIKVATEMAAVRNVNFHAYSPRLEGATWVHNRMCGMHGIEFTTTIPFHVDLPRKHLRSFDDAGTAVVDSIEPGATTSA